MHTHQHSNTHPKLSHLPLVRLNSCNNAPPLAQIHLYRQHTQLDLSNLAHSLIHMHDHSNISHIICGSFSFSCAHTETHTPSCQMIHPRNSTQHLADRGFVSCYISCIALYRTPCASWWITCTTGWMAPHPPSAPCVPFHPICGANLSSSQAICYFARMAVCFTCAGMFAYAHTSDSLTPAHSYGWDATVTWTQGTCSLSPVAICLIFNHSPSWITSQQSGSFKHFSQVVLFAACFFPHDSSVMKEIKRWIRRWKLDLNVKIALCASVKQRHTNRIWSVCFLYFNSVTCSSFFGC